MALVISITKKVASIHIHIHISVKKVSLISLFTAQKQKERASHFVLPICKKVLSAYQYTTAVTPQHPEGILLSSTLFTYMYGNEPVTATILGGKTGFVNESGYCIASYGENNENGNEYIVVTLGNSARMPAFFGQIDLYKEFAK